MFYSETILSRRGPLGRVWLAAHMERKLSKSQTLQTNIEESVDAIMDQDIEVMALRLSGQLLLGVVRIYSRKAKYLLDDCNEALLKIKTAFRPGVVDLTEEQLTVNKTAITLPTNGVALDLLMPDADWVMDYEDRPLQPQAHHQAHVDDITLRTTDDFQLGIGDAFDVGPSDGIDSHDFNDALDLGIDWDGEPGNDKSGLMSAEGSVGVGRDAQFDRDSLGPDLFGNGFGGDFDALSHRTKSRDPSQQPLDQSMDVDFPEAGLDLGDFGIGFDNISPVVENEKTPGETRSLSRASSPLTEPPLTPLPLEPIDLNVAVEQTGLEKTKRRPKDKKQIIDSVTELQNETSNKRGRAGATANPLNTDTTAITSDQHFLPRSSIVMRLLEIRENPVNYFLPTQTKGNNNIFSAAPPGLTPELAELFARSMPSTSVKRKGASPDDSPSKRSRRDEVEVARRAESVAASEGNINAEFNISGFDDEMVLGEVPFAEDFQLDIAQVDLDLDGGRAKSVATDRSRLSSVAPGGMDFEERVLDGSCPVAIFDVSQPSQTQASQAADGEEEGDIPENEKGYSKNTNKALGLIRRELQPLAEEEQRTMSFKNMTTNASRRAASSFFFELLVLGTRDCVQVIQPSSFSDIQVSAKPRLWEHQQHLHGNMDRASEPLA